MSVNMPVVRIEPPQAGVKQPVSSRELKNNGHGDNPSFGVLMKDDGKAFRTISWLGDGFTSAMQRFVSGITAIVTQPFFDLNNKNVDEDTRKTSCARTMGKIIAGTFTGVLIRKICIDLTKKFTQNKNIEIARYEKEKEKLLSKGKDITSIKPSRTEFKPWEQILLPKSKLEAGAREIKKYRGAFGTFAAVAVMVFTNFIIDAPLTTYLTNVFVKKFKENDKQKQQQIAEGGNK